VLEITISRTALRRCLVGVPISLLLLLGTIGAAISPMVNGHPVILTRERLALQDYLKAAQDWIQRLDEIAVHLDALSPRAIATANNIITSTSMIAITPITTGSLPAQINLPTQSSLAAFAPPANQPTQLFERAQAAEHILQDLQALGRDLQQIETPVAFNGLQDIAAETVQAFAAWSSQVLDAMGAPTPDTTAMAQVSRQTALVAFGTLRQALAQQGLQP
jgi:hypothetical protein